MNRNFKSNGHKARSKQAGFTLVEIGVVVAIASTIVVLALAVVPTVLANNRANAEMQEFPAITTNIQKTYSNSPTYANVTLDGVIRLNAFPTERVTVPSTGLATATNRWGGTVTLTPANLTATNDIARLVYTNVGTRECKTVLQGVAGLARRIYVDSANAGAAGGGTLVKGDGLPLDLVALGTACGTATASVTYDIGK